MTNQFESSFSEQEQRENDELQIYESAIRRFLDEQWPVSEKKHRYSFGEFDVSAPQREDLIKVQSGDFSITHFRTSPRKDSKKKNFSFYVGKTEFHISGKAADRIYELMEQDEQK